MVTTEHKSIFVTASDKEKLNLLFVAGKNNRARHEAIRNLARELQNMEVRRPEDIPSYVITMHTEFAVQHMENGSTAKYTLVYPGAADYESGMISVMSPLGASLLGQTPDSLVEYEAPGGIKQVKVLAILNQPEASGNYNG